MPLTRRARAPFLTAEWRDLVMLNFAVAPALLTPLCPTGVVLDNWEGRHWASVVGLQFRNTQIRGWAIPGHVNFPEVNLRFYVRRETSQELIRGVVFVREFVPRRAVAIMARLAYNENYATAAMSGKRQENEGTVILRYEWKYRGVRHCMAATARGEPQAATPDSLEEFVSEHYWGYTRQRDGSTMAYQVEHPRWPVWQAEDIVCELDAAALYGREWARALAGPPVSAFGANGSAVSVHAGAQLAG